MNLAPSSRIFVLLSLLLPIMVVSGGCMFILHLIWRDPPNRSIAVIADDAAYYRPPDAFFWQWLPRVADRDPKTGEILLVERRRELDTPLLIGDLRNRLKAEPGTTAAAYFSGHGMSCKPAGDVTECDYAMAASFVCRYILDDKPLPTDHATRYPGKVRIVVRLTSDNVVTAAFATPQASCPLPVSAPRR